MDHFGQPVSARTTLRAQRSRNLRRLNVHNRIESEKAVGEPPLVLRVTDLAKTYPLTKGAVLPQAGG